MGKDFDVDLAVSQMIGNVSGRLGLLSWGACMGLPAFEFSHDKRGAPFVPAGQEGEGELLMSRADEGAVALTAWVVPAETSRVIGFGVDLVVRDDFEGKLGAQREALLLTERDRRHLAALSDDASTAQAFAFSAKEAAFKACSQPARCYSQARLQAGCDFAFEFRDFELEDAMSSWATARRSEALLALEAFGIERIELERVSAGELLATAAFALARR